MYKRDMRYVCLRIAGEGGEGVISAGELLTQVAGRLGMHVSTFKTFPAEIRGGTAVYQIRTGPDHVLSQGDYLDVLVAFNREGYDRNIGDLTSEGVLLHDFEPGDGAPVQRRGGVNYHIPMGKLSKEAGSTRAKNMVALGAICELFGFPLAGIEDGIRKKFGKKSEKIVESNLRALHLGAQYVREDIEIRHEIKFTPGDGNPRVVLSGNDAIAFGAVAAGCRFYGGYPITPATEIMEWLARELPRLGGRMVQAEDEIAAIAMCIGASFAGQKSMTASSGPGIALMSEALGLATMAEIGIVVVDVQRAGPSTGMPTKAEQGDLNLALYGTHSTAQRVVIAPVDIEDCFYQTVNAFNIASKYQIPVMILSEQSLGFSKASMPRPDFESLAVYEEVFADKETDGDTWPKVDEITVGEGYPMTPVFPRYLRHTNGISPRSIPGMPGLEFRATGLEHDEFARPRYDPPNRKAMLDKRLAKFEEIRREYGEEVEVIGDNEAEVAITGWGTTAGVIRHATVRALNEGAPIKAIFPKMLSPMPDNAMRRHLHGVKRVICCELNDSGQYANIIRHRYGVNVHAVLKDHGVPFAPGEIKPYIDMAIKGEVRI
jgi:2-oxoglutarate/2-oxoacid ferredoxin oxidoreductase subunit alpha